MRLGTHLPFAQAAEELAFFWGVELEETTVRRATEAAGAAYVAEQEAERERLERERPAPPPGPAVQYLSADGAMVPLVGGTWAEVKTLAIGDVVQRPGKDGVPEAHTTALSYFSRLADAETFIQAAYVEVHRRGTETAGVVCAVQDGAEWEQRLVDLFRPDAVRILDFPHGLEHLTTAAQPTLGQGTPALHGWLEQRAHALKHRPDGARRVLRALARLPVGRAADPLQARAARDAAVGYFTRRLAQVRYAAFVAAGYPIGSGSTESANKVVVEARLKGRGMHWAREHVNPLVALRTVACNGRWSEAWPRISARLRNEAAQHRRARRAARRPIAPARAVCGNPSPTLVAAPVRPPITPPVARPKTVVNGRPTRWHPWRRYPLHLGHHTPPAAMR